MRIRWTFVPAFLSSLLFARPAIASAEPPRAAAEDVEAELTPEAVYRASLKFLSDGRQAETERVLAQAVKTFPNDSRLWFFGGACERSRFDVKAAAPAFVRAFEADPKGKYGQAAAIILNLDAKRQVPRAFAALERLVKESPDDPLLLWMAGVQCRALNRNEKGIEYYGRLLKQLDPGPAIVHQTYANLLDEVGRSADAVPHREQAVRLEPAGWSYQGVGNTLTRLKRWQEADAAYEKCTAMRPRHGQYWENWAWSMESRGDDAGTVDKCERGLAVAPRSTSLWRMRADAERRRKRFKEALECYEHALAIAPRSTRALAGAIAVLRELGDERRAGELERQLAAINGQPTTSPSTAPAPAAVE